MVWERVGTLMQQVKLCRTEDTKCIRQDENGSVRNPAVAQQVKNPTQGVPIMAQRKRIRLGAMRLQVPSLASLSGLRIFGVCQRYSSDPVLPWLWCRPAAAAAIQLLTWKLAYAAGVALKRKKNFFKKPLVQSMCAHVCVCMCVCTHVCLHVRETVGRGQKHCGH